MSGYAWLIPFLPAASALICGVWGKRLRTATGWISICAMLVSSILTVAVLIAFLTDTSHVPFRWNLYQWIAAGAFSVRFSLAADRLTAVMLIVVSAVGTLVFIYSTGYMKDERGYPRFFSFLSLFAAAMYLLVMADNFLVLFIGWEGVGLCSYLLIGYYLDRQYCADAGRKAFIVNRIGDAAFVLGIALIYDMCGSLEFSDVFAFFENDEAKFRATPLMTIATLLLFGGAIGKSAQIPLFVWLPDAMAGPTPVSALIHAATMVTAGVYMVARCSVLFLLAPMTMTVIAITGVATAFVAASIALTQTDIKRVLAYSTISQLGFMFLALGVGAFATGIFHLYTHAFFKAALFLAAGSVLTRLHHDNDMARMGGLRKLMPVTWVTYLIATLAICGCPLTAGFFSKDEILWRVFAQETTLAHVLWVTAVVTAMMTAVYMFRSLFLTFHGESRVPANKSAHLREAPSNMVIPVIALAAGSLAAGWVGLPDWAGGSKFEHFLLPVTGFGHQEIAHHAAKTGGESHTLELLVTAVSVLVFAAGLALAVYYFLFGYPVRAEQAARRWRILHRISAHRWWWDEFYNAVVVRVFMVFAAATNWFDNKVVDGFVNAVAGTVAVFGDEFRRLQNGRVQYYALGVFVGVNLILIVLFGGHLGKLLSLPLIELH